jgi:hypothetical protein
MAARLHNVTSHTAAQSFASADGVNGGATEPAQTDWRDSERIGWRRRIDRRVEALQTSDPVTAAGVRLPVHQMKERALAEGVLPRDGRRTGFVYFEQPDVEELDLNIDLVSAESDQFGTITIPFFFD